MKEENRGTWDVMCEMEDLCLSLNSLSSLIAALDCYMIESHTTPPRDLLSIPANSLQEISKKITTLVNEAMTQLQKN